MLAPGLRWPFGTPSAELSLGQVASPQSLPPFHPVADHTRKQPCGQGDLLRQWEKEFSLGVVRAGRDREEE